MTLDAQGQVLTGSSKYSWLVQLSKVTTAPWAIWVLWLCTDFSKPWQWLFLAAGLYLEAEYLASPTKFRWTAEDLTASWIWGSERTWPLKDLRLETHPTLRAFLMSADQVTLEGRKIFLFWPRLMRGGQGLRERLREVGSINSSD